jgi:hypothetical protein
VLADFIRHPPYSFQPFMAARRQYDYASASARLAPDLNEKINENTEATENQNLNHWK